MPPFVYANFSQPLKAFLVTKFFAYSQSVFAQFLINIYFWRITKDIHFLVFYNIIYALSHVLIYLSVGNLLKEYNRLFALRVGIIIQLLYLGSILALGDSIPHYIIVIGLIGGIADGLYWSSDNLLKFDLTEPDNRLSFTALCQIFKNATGSLIPLFASLLVVTGNGSIFHLYGKVFFAAIVCAIFVFISSFFISDEGASSSGKFRFFKAIKTLWVDKNIQLACYSTFLAKISDVIPILLGLLLFIGSGTELSFGSYQFITVVITVITNYFLGRYFSRKEYRKLLIFGGMANFVCTFILLINQSYLSILLYGILSSLVLFMNTPQNPMVLDALTMHCKDEFERRRVRVEYMTLQEFFDGAGKITGYLTLLLVSTFSNTLTIGIIIGFCALCAFASNIVIARIKERS